MLSKNQKPFASLRLCAFALCLLFFAACTAQSATPDAANVVLRYMEAKAAGDGDTIRSLLCAERESMWQQEAASFSSVEARIENASCSMSGDNTVTCSGDIVAVYGLDTTSFPLSSYNVTQEDGEWKWCGEAG